MKSLTFEQWIPTSKGWEEWISEPMQWDGQNQCKKLNKRYS